MCVYFDYYDVIKLNKMLSESRMIQVFSLKPELNPRFAFAEETELLSTMTGFKIPTKITRIFRIQLPRPV